MILIIVNNTFNIQYFNIYGKKWSKKNYFIDWLMFYNNINHTYFNNKYFGSIYIKKILNIILQSIYHNINLKIFQ